MNKTHSKRMKLIKIIQKRKRAKALKSWDTSKQESRIFIKARSLNSCSNKREFRIS